MNKEEFLYIDRLIADIHANLQWDPTQELTQREFEFLIDSVYLKTKTRVSLSTIKRIWYHENAYLPRVSTLDILCQYLDYEGWSHYKTIDETISKEKKVRPKTKTKRSFLIGNRLRLAGVILVLVVVIVFVIGKVIFDPRQSSYDNIKFELNKIVGNEVPVTVVFNYDISDQEFDSAFIQLSWNRLERHPISKEGNVLTSMYYYPGIHQAKLLINDSIVKTHDVYIEDPRWLCIFRNEPEDVVPIYINNESVLQDGYIQATPVILNASKADTLQESYYVSYFRAEDFGVSADDFSFTTRFKNPTLEGKFYCQNSAIYIYTENGGLYLTLSAPGCVGNTGIVVGDKVISGRTNDLSSLGRDYSEWQNLKAVVKDMKLEIFLNDTLAFETSYSEKMGRILTWQYFFTGCGAVDHLSLSNSQGERVYHEDFSN